VIFVVADCPSTVQMIYEGVSESYRTES